MDIESDACEFQPKLDLKLCLFLSIIMLNNFGGRVGDAYFSVKIFLLPKMLVLLEKMGSKPQKAFINSNHCFYYFLQTNNKMMLMKIWGSVLDAYFVLFFKKVRVNNAYWKSEKSSVKSLSIMMLIKKWVYINNPKIPFTVQY